MEREKLNDIKKLMSFDSLSTAEKLTGTSYKEDEETVLLGMAMMQANSKLKEKALSSINDTTFSEKTESYLKKVTDFGFEIALVEKFYSESSEQEEEFYIMWHTVGILLTFDTYRGSRNGGNIYYQWSPNDMEKMHSLTSTGGFKGVYFNSDFTEEFPNPEDRPKWNCEDWETHKKASKEWGERDRKYRTDNNLRALWIGSHDCREGIKTNISLLADNGVFLNKWVGKQFLWLLHHNDTKAKGYDYENITKERFDKLPEHVKTAIGAAIEK